jgi:hypothetical protein
MSIDPPDIGPPPKWAKDLTRSAKARNHAMGADEDFTIEDLIAAWSSCGGHCAVSGLPFSLQVVGDGQARHPFAPSLDRIDRHKPYQRDNVRLVVSIANFAMNAWGDEPLLQLASAVHKKHGDRRPPSEPAPSDGGLDEIATTDAELVETDAGTLAFPPRLDLHQPILELLGRPRSSRELENVLAERFGITRGMRAAKLRSGCPAWRNHVAWALVDLGTHKGGRGGTGQIERVELQRAPDGGTMGLYRLAPQITS